MVVQQQKTDEALKNKIHKVLKEYMPRVKFDCYLNSEKHKLRFSCPCDQEPVNLDLNEKLLTKIPGYTVQAEIIHDGEHKGFSRIYITVI